MSITKDKFTIINNEIDIFQQTGIPGPPGVHYTPSVSEDGILSWSNSGNLPNPPDVNIKGKSLLCRCNTLDDLPSVGDSDTIYLIIDTYDIYAWDPDNIQFIKLNKINNLKINSIICGDSSE